jgi:hypothetical protein
MNTKNLKDVLNQLRALTKETEWVEFKVNYVNQEEIGELISALSNAACMREKQHAFLSSELRMKHIMLWGQNSNPSTKRLVMKS